MFEEIFSGTLESCILMGCCYLYQNDEDIRYKILSIFKDFNLNLIPINILVNLEPINDQKNDKYLYLSKKDKNYKLLGIRSDQMFQTVFNEPINIQSYFPVEINREIAKFSGFETIKNISPYFKSISNIQFQKLSEAKQNPIAVIIDEELPIPSSVQYAIIRDDVNLDLSKTGIKYLATEDNRYPKNVEILIYAGADENKFQFSHLENLKELDAGFQIRLDDYVLPKSLRKLTCSIEFNNDVDLNNFLEKLSNLNSLTLTGYAIEKINIDLKYLPNLTSLSFDGDIDIDSINFKNVNLKKLVCNFNNPKHLTQLPLSLEYLDIEINLNQLGYSFSYILELNYLINLKTLIVDTGSINNIKHSRVNNFGVSGFNEEIYIDFDIENFFISEIVDEDIEILVNFKNLSKLKSVNYLNKNTPDVETIILDKKLLIKEKLNLSKFKNLKNIEVSYLLKENKQKLKIFEKCIFPDTIKITYEDINPIQYMKDYLYELF